MPSRNEADLHPALQEVWREGQRLAKAELNTDIFLTCTHRSNEEQGQLWLIGRDGPNDDRPTVTNARPGQSAHNVAPPEGAHAFDFGVYNSAGRPTWEVSRFIAVAAIFRRLGADCGAFWEDFTDPPHVQMPGWRIGKTYGPNFRFMPRGVKARPTLERKPMPKFVRVMRASDNAELTTGTLIADKVYLDENDLKRIRDAKEST